MIVIDGSQGEGGGQIFRSSLTLAVCLGQPVRLQKIRTGRSKAGLLRQHLTCLNAAKTICNASVTGDQLGSTEVLFIPGKVAAGNYRFAIGSAGSTNLVFQTIALPLFFADDESEILFEGGTHNGYSPSFDFIHKCFLPLMSKIGFNAEASLSRFGFYPAGGGAWKVKISPARELKPLILSERGEVIRQKAVATSSRIPEHVTERELAHVRKKCGWSDEALEQRLVKSEGPGNIVSLYLESEHVTEIFECVGSKGFSAERVAGKAIKAMKQYIEANVPVGEHLADQLLLPMLLARGGSFRTHVPSQHLLTNINVIEQFTGASINLTQQSKNVWLVEIPGNASFLHDTCRLKQHVAAEFE